MSSIRAQGGIELDLTRVFEDVRPLCKLLFRDDKDEPLVLTSYQEEIVRKIIFKTDPYVLCWSTTRAGKSLAVAVGAILLSIFSKGERIRIIAPTVDHTRIVMGYVIQHILDNPIIIQQLTFDAKGSTIEHLRKELSKNRITFKNRSEIMILTANILAEGRSLIGFGGTVIIVDEGESIPSDIIRTKIMRMVGDTPEPLVFMISNPVQKGYMYDQINNPRWSKIHVSWEQVVAEGRLTKEFVDERKREMTDIEFQIWYEAVYPEEGEDQLIPYKRITYAREKYETIPAFNPKSRLVLGVDVASMGNDYTLFTSTEITPENEYIIRDIQSTAKTSTMTTVGKIIDLDSKNDYYAINVDSTGLGTGVYDRLNEQKIGSKLNGINFGSGADEINRDRYANMKAELYFQLRKIFEDGRIAIPNNSKLIDQLNKIRFEFTSSGKIMIIKPEDKSPDEADSLALSCYAPTPKRVVLDFIDLSKI